MRLPRGLSFGHQRRAMLWLMITTGGESAVSASVKKRPARSGIRIVAKYRGSTTLKAEFGISGWDGVGRSETWYTEPQQRPPTGGQRVALADCTPGRARISSSDRWRNRKRAACS